ncbi:uncharacterized protein DUF4136 [Gelidibacter sediminis]|uniref:Uncharacterized protein DUF4136 n=1 Tax=Gelidibacter sediminis TaxID=1608710 RepID=A0A4R7PIQ4_9FLAO|nr:DUF4136 domain-containing protein [Gelidibacter sediminis]TDU33782.1 uncharacterized protein DUF4136 [Gelidibacter sediminis]
MKKRIVLIVCFAVIMACAPVRVHYDYERGTDFNSYKTYNYYESMDTGMSELDFKRMVEALDAGLQAKGLQLSEQPDFLINIKSSQFQENQRNNVGVGVGGSGRSVGGGISIGIPVGQPKISREIVIEFIDDSKSGLFWQAVSDSNYNPNATPDAKESQFNVIVAKVLAQYPPKN